jgi:small subunit ribosomal protein S8
VPLSRIKEEITKVLCNEKYLLDYRVVQREGEFPKLVVDLKYQPKTKAPVIVKIARTSTPGLRVYRGKEKMPHILNGLGISVVSTSQGVMSDKEARRRNVGGELLCYVY